MYRRRATDGTQAAISIAAHGPAYYANRIAQDQWAAPI